MSRIILDLGSGNTCKNDIEIIKEMINSVAEIDRGKHEVIFKMQLFENSKINIPLKRTVFSDAVFAANIHGYKMTASVFDESSVKFLERFKVPFIKIANSWNSSNVVQYVKADTELYVSYRHKNVKIRFANAQNVKLLCCVSSYPADIVDYEYGFSATSLRKGISDHTVGFELFNKYKPEIWEKHLKLPDSTGPDSGEFAVTPEQLKEILW